MTVWGIVVAAGSGERFGGRKHVVELGGKPVWRWAVDALVAANVDRVVLVGDVDGAVPGGVRRRDSVAAGLAEVPDEADFVLVHDAARPLASPDLAARVIERLAAGGVDGVIPVVSLRDTIKRIDGETVTGTVDRSLLGAAQTPQGFRTDSLRRAHAHYDRDATDDAGMVEATGGVVVAVDGERSNLKLTYPEDIPMLEALL